MGIIILAYSGALSGRLRPPLLIPHDHWADCLESSQLTYIIITMPDLPNLEKISFASYSVRVFGTRDECRNFVGFSSLLYTSLKTDCQQEVNGATCTHP